jgi:protoporphyrin/coproporphyrin ferrochelatase
LKFTPPLYAARGLDPGQRTGVVLLGMGGPDRGESVGPFLTNLFADPLILPLPSWFSGPLGKIIVRRRLAEVTARYASLGHGGGSPQLDWTRRQAERLAAHLAAQGLDVVPAVAMRYWHPYSDDAVASVRAAGASQLVAVPTYPQYSAATTGTSLADLERARRHAAPWMPVHVIRQWPLLGGYLEALAATAAARLAEWRQSGVDPAHCALVYTAHSLPRRFERRGDPYVRQTRATVAAAQARLRALVDTGWLDALHAGGAVPCLAFQSKVGPVRWVGPPTFDTCVALGRAGVTHLLVVPVSFACEHIETLDELDRELAHAAGEAGVTCFARAPALNLNDGWLRSLADLIVSRAFRRQPSSPCREVAP